MNEENFASAADELTQDQWWLILWSFLTDVPEKEWNEFVHDLIYKDRFSSSHKVVDVINNFSEKCTVTIKKGQVLYRSRVYSQDPLREFLSGVFKRPAVKEYSYMNDNIHDYFNMLFASIVLEVKKGSPQGKHNRVPGTLKRF